MIPWQRPFLGGREKRYLAKAMASSWISDGPFVADFEAGFRQALGARHGITTCSGTAALELAVLALDIGPGDEVIVPGYGFAAAANMVLKARAKPVFVDVDPGTWCLDPKAAERAVTRRTRALLPIHVYGNVCDMTALSALARRRGLALIEDAAEAAFSTWRGRSAGTFGDVGCFSFQATKTLTTGEGGFAAVASKRLYETMRVIRNHGMQGARKYWHTVVGANFRLTNLQAAVGLAQLERRREIVAHKRRIWERYCANLAGAPGLALQRIDPLVKPVMWTAAALLSERPGARVRDRVMRRLAARGIETRPGFYSFHEMPLYRGPALPVAGSLGADIINLPSYCGLSDRDIDRVCRELRAAL